MMSNDTRELIWRRALGLYHDEDAVAWALAEIERHPARANLSALAMCAPPLNRFEVEDLLQRAFVEIGVKEPPEAESYREFVYETGRAILDGALSPREGCKRLGEACGADVDRRELWQFYRLHHGIQNLEHGIPQYYYEGLTLANLDDIIRREARMLVQKVRPG